MSDEPDPLLPPMPAALQAILDLGEISQAQILAWTDFVQSHARMLASLDALTTAMAQLKTVGLMDSTQMQREATRLRNARRYYRRYLREYERRRKAAGKKG